MLGCACLFVHFNLFLFDCVAHVSSVWGCGARVCVQDEAVRATPRCAAHTAPWWWGCPCLPLSPWLLQEKGCTHYLSSLLMCYNEAWPTAALSLYYMRCGAATNRTTFDSKGPLWPIALSANSEQRVIFLRDWLALIFAQELFNPAGYCICINSVISIPVLPNTALKFPCCAPRLSDM